MRVTRTLGAGIVFLAAISGALGQTQAPPDDFTLCQGVAGVPQQQSVAPCTRVINNPRTPKARLAAALLRRCRLGGEGFVAPAALKDCNRAVALMPKSADAYDARADVYESMSDYQKAIDDLTTALKYNDRPLFDYFSRGRVFNERAEYERFFPAKQAQRAKDYDSALADLTRVVDAKPPPGSSDNAQMMVGILQSWAQDEVTKAQKGKEETVRVGAVDPRLWCRGESIPPDGPPFDRIILGCTAVINTPVMTKTERGEAYFRRARAKSDEGPGLLVLGGLLQQRLPVPDSATDSSALVDYRSAIALNAEVAQSHYGSGVLFLVGGKFDRAQSEFTKAIDLKGPDLARYYDARGQASFYAGKLMEAIADTDRSLELKPDDPNVLLDRAMMRDRAGNYELALADCNRAATLAEGIAQASANALCGDFYFHKADYRNAIAEYDAALSANSEQMAMPEAFYGRGAAKIRLGDKAGGQADIDAAVKQFPDIAAAEQKNKIAP